VSASVLFSFWPVLPVDGMAVGVAAGVLCCAVGFLAKKGRRGVPERTE